MAAFGPTRFWVDCVHIRFFGNGGLWFRPYGESLWQTPQRNQRSGPLRSAPRCGSAFLRSGIHPGASPTVCFAAPPLDACGFAARSLRSHPRINPSTQPSDGAGTSRAVLELTLIVLSGGKPKRKRRFMRKLVLVLVLVLVRKWTLTLTLKPMPMPMPMPMLVLVLALARRYEWTYVLQNPSSPRYLTSAYLSQTPRSVPSPSGRGLG